MPPHVHVQHGSTKCAYLKQPVCVCCIVLHTASHDSLDNVLTHADRLIWTLRHQSSCSPVNVCGSVHSQQEEHSIASEASSDARWLHAQTAWSL